MNRLKELRKEKKLTQQELADYMQITRRGYQKWESGESQIKPDKAEELAKIFNVSVAYLLGYSDFPARNLRELILHEIKSSKEYKVIRIGNENFISEDRVLNIIDKYMS